MANLEYFKSQGWNLTSEGLNKLCENERISDNKVIARRALDFDLREIGAPVIATEINKDVFGPVILQLVKLRNISAPKSKPLSQSCPRMLKLSLTDGHSSCQAVEVGPLSGLSLENTPPGTKLMLQGAPVVSGCLLIDSTCCKVLGGNVTALVQRWQLSKLMPSHIRVTEDGPPAWVNFGKKIITNLNNQSFKSLENKTKDSKEDAQFQNQRQDAISEAAQGAVKKIFGGGVKITNIPDQNAPKDYQNPRASNIKPRNKAREKTETEKQEKPSQRVSLFDFLEDKLPPSEKPPNVRNHIPESKPHEIAYKKPVPKPAPKYEPKEKKPDNRFKPSERYQIEKPPRFQRKEKFTDKPESSRVKPDTNDFINKLANEINNISLYNSKYENEKLNKTTNENSWKWKIGDRCMAKYWEDNKFYNAIVTGITTKTCMVEFLEYGNFEEVLHCDCIPISTEKEETKKHYNDNQQISGNTEYRRGKNRSFVNKNQKQFYSNRNFE